jgi:molecular chaperone DnaJ
VVGTRSFEVEVPAGIESGQRLRIAGGGHAGEPGGRPGDLYVRIGVGEDERFQREGRDLVTLAHIPATDAMLGTTIEIPTLDGDDEEVEVPPGTQQGDQVALRGRGLPGLGRSARGDHYVVFSVIVPSNLDEEQRDLTRRLAGTLREENLQPKRRDGIFARVRRALG